MFISPDSVTVRLGQVTSGGVDQIADIDNRVLRICKFIVPNQLVAPITVEVNGTSSILNPAKLVFRTFSKMNVSGLFSETIDMFDWSTNTFSATAATTTTISTTNKAVAVVANTPISRSVDGVGKVRARYRIRQTGPAGSFIWCHELDQAVWFVR